MTEFYDGKYNVLLSTTIVESGLDIPTANTLIMHKADMFGLAQLYQLRGRVGRAKQRGYALFTYGQNKPLTKQAEKRLQVLQSLDTLGAGFTLASHDLDIRGAGNLLGEEQSGHIKEVGYELYQAMLEEAITSLKSGNQNVLTQDKWSPQINLGTAVLIPENYVSDLSLRLNLYRRLSLIEEKEDLQGFKVELIDRFGELPLEVEHLLKIVEIKAACRIANVETVDAGPRGATLTFRDNSFPNPEGLIEYMSKPQNQAKLKADHKLVMIRSWASAEDRLTGTGLILEKLKQLSKTE
jgi:transcription-repair coupling factor (superfamily II helicase)